MPLYPFAYFDSVGDFDRAYGVFAVGLYVVCGSTVLFCSGGVLCVGLVFCWCRGFGTLVSVFWWCSSVVFYVLVFGMFRFLGFLVVLGCFFWVLGCVFILGGITVVVVAVFPECCCLDWWTLSRR